MFNDRFNNNKQGSESTEKGPNFMRHSGRENEL